MQIRSLLLSEFPLIAGFPPQEWNFDFASFLSLHFGQSYFHALVADIDGRIVGCGTCLLNGETGWLGNIIVLPEYRNQGIGYQITQGMVEFFEQQGCTSQVLIATKMGERVYAKLGFTTRSTYSFYRRETSFQLPSVQHIRRASPPDFPALLEIDQAVSGERRAPFIQRFFSTAWVYAAGSPTAVRGFYLPDLGGGLVIALDAEAGAALLGYKLSLGVTTVVIPSTNTAARDLLILYGFAEYASAPRMALGAEVGWKPELVFSRGAGYCG